MFSSHYIRNHLKYDFVSSIVVFLVAIPLCLGIALASGAPLFSGIISGIIGGIVVGLMSDSPVSVSGPAAGIVAVVLTGIAQLGGFDTFLLALFFAGILQIIIGIFKAGFIADYVPSNVIQGLICAIGLLIIIKQLPLAFTHASDVSTLMKDLKISSETIHLSSLTEIISHINLGASIISLISLGLLIYFDKTTNKQMKLIPGSIVVVFAAILINECFTYLFPHLSQFNEQLVNIPIINGSMQAFLSGFTIPNWDAWQNPLVYVHAVTLTAVASLETLLNLNAAEKLDKKKRYCSRSRELVAQGFGNVLCGLVGGLPVTSVVVRTSVNIQSGARTKYSAVFHGVLMALIVMLIPEWINLIPLAALAAILIYVGYKLSNVAIYKAMYQQGQSRFLPFLVTIIAILSSNLLLGVIIGLIISFFFILRDNSRIRLDIINEKHTAGIVKRLVLPQQVSFLRKASLIAELENIEPETQLIVDARYTKYIDLDILDVIHEFAKVQAPNKNIALNLLGFKDHYELHDHINFLSVTTYDVQSSLTPEQVLEILKEGNHRFITDQRIFRNLQEDIQATAIAHHPIAVVLGCIDARVPVETIFDMSVGDMFVIRVAGNVVNDDVLASLEFSCQVAGAKLIIVLGHTNCGAIKAASENVTGGHLTDLLNKIKPAIQEENVFDRSTNASEKDQFMQRVTKINALHSMEKIYSQSVIINRLIRDEHVGLVTAIYDVASGQVNFEKSASDIALLPLEPTDLDKRAPIKTNILPA